MARRKINKNCPLTEDEILTFKAMLYQVNTSHRCVNPAPFSWVHGYQWWQTEKVNTEMKQKIQITGKNWTEIFSIPCVEYIEKALEEHGGVRVWLYGSDTPAYIGDWLVEDDNEEWRIKIGEVSNENV